MGLSIGALAWMGWLALTCDSVIRSLNERLCGHQVCLPGSSPEPELRVGTFGVQAILNMHKHRHASSNGPCPILTRQDLVVNSPLCLSMPACSKRLLAAMPTEAVEVLKANGFLDDFDLKGLT